MDLDAYQRASAATDIRSDTNDPTIPLLGLAGEVGSMVTEYKKRLREGDGYSLFKDEVREDLGDLLWYAAALARTAGLSLDEIAQTNLLKTNAIWHDELGAAAKYDEIFPLGERLPRKFTLRFVSTTAADGLPRVKIYLGEKAVGDPLDDNAYEEDHYRYHDAFHVAHAAVLGWSPVLRRMLKRKRKSEPMVDRVEDGARAVVLEEGLTAFIFSEAVSRGFFAQSQRVDWDVIKTVQRMVSHLEVRDQPANAWRRAILDGYGLWRRLRENDGGLVTVDLERRAVTWVAPE